MGARAHLHRHTHTHTQSLWCWVIRCHYGEQIYSGLPLHIYLSTGGEGNEDWIDVGGLLVTHCHSNIWTWVVAQNHVWVYGPAASTVCVDIHISCYY